MSAWVRHVRVRTRSRDPAAVRLAVSRQLGASDLEVPGLAPSSILVLRRLSDPLPGRLGGSGSALAADPRWQSAARERIAERARSAVRPVRGRIPGDPEAIVFGDEAELFACLALQVASASMTSWWHDATMEYARARSLFGLLRTKPELVPAIVTTLLHWHVVEGVVSRLTQSEVLEIAAAVATAQGLDHLNDGLVRFREERSRRASLELLAKEPTNPAAPADLTAVVHEGAPRERSNQVNAAVGALVLAPWHEFWRPSANDLATEHVLLIGSCVALQRAPAIARSEAFAERAFAWAVWSSNGRGDAESATRESSRGASTVYEESKDARVRSAPTERKRAPSPIQTDDTASPQDEATELAAAASTLLEPLTVAGGVLGLENESGSAPWLGSEAVSTELGGVFFLINVMQHLDLPDVFETQCRLASAVGALGTLETLARALIHPASDQALRDPVWSFLAELDGRERGSPPRGNELLVEATTLPDSWALQANGLFTAGVDEELAARLRDEGWPPVLVRWLELVTPFVRFRIRAALGSEPGAGADLVSDLLRLPARVYASAAHLDVVSSLEAIRVPVRLAGLDRSPGWVRSMQRVVRFHFE